MSRLWQTIISTVTGTLVAYLSSISVPISVLVSLMVLDYLSGIIAAGKYKEIDSSTGSKGITKKVGQLMLVFVGMGADYLVYISTNIGIDIVEINIKFSIAIIISIWLIINELTSITENLNKIGVPIPNFLTKILRRTKSSIDKETEDK